MEDSSYRLTVTVFVSTETGLAATRRLYLGQAAGGELFLLTSPFIERLRRAKRSPLEHRRSVPYRLRPHTHALYGVQDIDRLRNICSAQPCHPLCISRQPLEQVRIRGERLHTRIPTLVVTTEWKT